VVSVAAAGVVVPALGSTACPSSPCIVDVAVHAVTAHTLRCHRRGLLVVCCPPLSSFSGRQRGGVDVAIVGGWSSMWQSWVDVAGSTWWARHGEVDAMGDMAVVDVVGRVDVVVDDVADVDVWWSMTRLASTWRLSTWLAGVAMAFVDVVSIDVAAFDVVSVNVVAVYVASYPHPSTRGGAQAKGGDNQIHQ